MHKKHDVVTTLLNLCEGRVDGCDSGTTDHFPINRKHLLLLIPNPNKAVLFFNPNHILSVTLTQVVTHHLNYYVTDVCKAVRNNVGCSHRF